MWKLLPALLLVVSCARYNAAANANAFIAYAARYATDATEIVAYRDNRGPEGIDEVLAAEKRAYSRLQRSSAAGYSDASLAEFRDSLVELENKMIDKGVKGYAHRPVNAH